ncbi:MAG: MATE family efflux transporter [Lachnospiraceae bacterium]|nr:MATE family efflux transporter [Lachnospiraceae bacterium]
MAVSQKQEQAREARRKMMLEEPMMRVIPKVAIPMIIASLIDSVYNLVDTLFVSQLGVDATAAVAVNDSLMHILRAISMGFAMGASSYISRLLGAKEDDKASRVGSSTLFIGIIFSLCFGLTCLAFRSTIVDLLGVTEKAKPYSMDYSFWILLAAPFTTAELIQNQLLRSEGSTTFAMIGMVSGCVLNIGLDPLFINVFHWGVAGAAGATALSKVVSAAVLAYPFIRKRTMLDIGLHNFKPDKEGAREVARMGVPAFLRMSLMSLGGIITNNVAKQFGSAVLAGISVANKLYRLVASAIMGFSQGFGPVAGFCYGARRYKRVKEAYFTTITIGVIAGAILGTLMFIFSRGLIGLFNSEANETMYLIGSLKIRALCLVLIPHEIVMITSNLYQSLGRPIGNLVLSMSRQLIFLIPMVLILPKIFPSFGLPGEYGLAVAQACSDGFACIFLALPLAIKMLKQIKLPDGAEPPFVSKKRNARAA